MESFDPPKILTVRGIFAMTTNEMDKSVRFLDEDDQCCVVIKHHSFGLEDDKTWKEDEP